MLFLRVAPKILADGERDQALLVLESLVDGLGRHLRPLTQFTDAETVIAELGNEPARLFEDAPAPFHDPRTRVAQVRVETAFIEVNSISLPHPPVSQPIFPPLT